MKAAERRKVIDERCGQPKDLDNASEDELRQICKEYFDRMYMCESQKYDMEFEVRKRGFEINELNIAVNDLRGKFIKPTLKKVSKYENKFAKLQKKAAEFNFRNQLKTVKKKEFTMDEEEELQRRLRQREARHDDVIPWCHPRLLQSPPCCTLLPNILIGILNCLSYKYHKRFHVEKPNL